MFLKKNPINVDKLTAENGTLKAKVVAFDLFDEVDYLEANPDVRKAVSNGTYKDGLTHFRSVGIREGRFPGFGSFDWHVYLRENGDLAHFRNEADPESAAKKHFREAGYREGRVFKEQ